MTRSLVTAVFCWTLLLGAGQAAADPDRRLTVVELFTSQGCSTCPPAEDFLGELAERPDVLALAFHVDYWDYIGWKDPFAQAAFTERQRAYARQFDLKYVYTPQMVVQGTAQMTGTDRAAVLAAIDEADRGPWLADVELLDRSGGLLDGGSQVLVYVEESEAARKRQGPNEVCDIWLVSYDHGEVTRVTRGENAGRQLPNPQVVRSLQQIGVWDGRRVQIAAPRPEGVHVAAFVQSRNTGRIMGAAKLIRWPP